MPLPVRVLLEHGTKKRVVASAFDWPGWDRSTKLGGDVLGVLNDYRDRVARVAELAGYGDEFERFGDLDVVEEVDGIGMTDYYGFSGRPASVELEPMTNVDFDRKLAMLRASSTTFDDMAARVSPELRKGLRGGGPRQGPHHPTRERCRDR